MNTEQVTAFITADIPDADVQIEDTRGDGRYLTVTVTSGQFSGLTRIQQHRKVQSALQHLIDDDVIHALQLTTRDR